MTEEKEQRNKNFFMVPNAVIDSWLWSRMKQSEKSVYLVLCRFANPDSGLAYPSLETIAELTGSAKDTICKATKQLVIYGLITKKRASSNFNFRMIYRVIKEPEINKHIIPWKKDKCKPKKDKKTGKFMLSPCSKDLDISPSSKDLDISPSSKEQKKIKEELRRLTITSMSHNLTKGKNQKKQRPKIDTGEKGWSKQIDALIVKEEKTKDNEEAKL
jgi:predicted transcriptional regulator